MTVARNESPRGGAQSAAGRTSQDVASDRWEPDGWRDGGASSPRPMASLPTRLRPADLLRRTDEVAADVLDGRYDHVLPANWSSSDHWSLRLTGDNEIDIWLVSWVPGKFDELHDHAGSLAALTMLTGSLDELRWDGAGISVRTLTEGDQASFPLGWVHDLVRRRAVGNDESPSLADPTLSVHAYSPPLTAMSYYDVDGAALRKTRTELVTGAEAIVASDSPARGA